jgi:hypothetical protein
VQDAAPPTSTGPPIYLAATDNGRDLAYATSRAAGLELAWATGARVVLYDRSSEFYRTDPYDPGGPDGLVPGPGRLLGLAALRRLGYGYFAVQLEQARELGLDADAALAWGAGPAAMASRCQQASVTHVILPATLARPSLWDRLLRRTLNDLRAKLAETAIILVGSGGELRELQSFDGTIPSKVPV